MSITNHKDILKLALLQEEGPIAFEQNPMEFILKKYVTLQQILMELMTPSYREYVDAIFVIAPKPTTFKIVLHNSQHFYLTYLGIAYEAQVAGMKYHLTNIGEKQRAMMGISRLLRAGNPNLSQGPEGAEDGGGFEDGGVAGGGGGGFSTGGGGEENSGMEGDWAEKTGFSPGAGEESGEESGGDELENLEEDLDPVSILREALSSGSKKKATEKAIDDIINSPEGKNYNFKKLSDWRRLGNLDKITEEDFLNIVNKVFSSPQVKIHPPKSGPNYSSKYNMYDFETQEGPVEIILAGGANLGEKYEKNLLDKMKSSAGQSIKDIEDPAVKKIFSTVKVDPKKLKADDIQFAGTTDTKRSLSPKGPTDVGEKIADVRIVPKNVNISIKNKDGDTLYNGGVVPFITQANGKVVYDKSKKDKNPIISSIVDSIGLKPQKMASGLNDYAGSKLEEDNSNSGFSNVTSYNKNVLKNILASAYGYGYYYVREKKKGEVEIKPILNKKDATDLVGTITSVSVKYPGPTSKSTMVKVSTKSPIFGENEYRIEFRNTSGKLLPVSYKISSKK